MCPKTFFSKLVALNCLVIFSGFFDSTVFLFFIDVYFQKLVALFGQVRIARHLSY